VTALSLGGWFQGTATDGSLVLAIPIVLVAGLVSFFSPCVVPLLPGYLSYMTGLSGADLGAARRGRMLLGAVLFVLGFSLIFVLLGAASGGLGNWLNVYKRQISFALGILTIVLGIAFLGALPFLQRDWRIHKVPAVGLAAAPMLGILFGFGWAPCIGPTLAAVLALTYTEASVTRGVLLSVVYCLGLGLPFIVAALAYRRMLGAIGFVRRHQQWVTRLGGLMLIAVGLLLVTGWWDVAVQWLQSHLLTNYTPAV
jgi:cytochrome c-type biogenesis protein